MMDITKETDETLLGWYQIHHGSNPLSCEIFRELTKRGYTLKSNPYKYADGSMGYAPMAFKDGKRII